MLRTLLWFLLAFCVIAAAGAQQPLAPAATSPATRQPDQSPPETSAPYLQAASAAAPATEPTSQESLLIGPGDLICITFVRESELDQHIRVLDSGEIVLALAGTVIVQGLTPAQAAARIADKYRDGKFLLHPEVSVFVEEYATETVTILGQVAHPGNFRLAAPRSLIDVLSLAGGLTDLADRHIVIERGAKPRQSPGPGPERIRAFLPNRADDALNANVLVRPGDTVIVPRTGIVYVLGDVAHPGGYVMQNDSQLTVLQAIALAAGASKTASEKRIRLVRNVDGLTQSIDLPLRDMERGRDPDVPLMANDVLYVPFSLAKNLSLGIANITAAASSALIYATH
ncbi:MAG TPA: SLBB domain-containing protein [Acidobacteriaceae bacterium]